MDEKILEVLDANAIAFAEKQIDSSKMGKFVAGFVAKCADFDDVESLIFFV